YYLLAILLFGNNYNACSQQDYYRTVNGIIQITGVLNDSVVVANSKKVTVLLNYETASFNLFFDIGTLRTGIDSLDKLLARQVGNFIEYEGKMGLEYVNTQSHGPQEFEVEGYINCNYHNKVIRGKGRLDHIYSGIYS